MICRTKLLMALACVAMTASAWAADWPQFFGPNANGIAPDTGINKNWNENPPQELWKVALGDKGFAGPSVADGKVFIIDHAGDQDVVRALDLQTGQDVWRYAYADTSKHNYGYARSTPTYADGKLYTLSRLGLLNCLDAGSGNLIWSKDIRREFSGEKPTWDYAASPFIDGDRVIVSPGGATSVVALNAATGETVWAGGNSDKAGYATPVLATIQGRRQYVVFTGYSLIGVDTEQGDVLWTVPWKTNYDVNAAMPLVIDDYIYVTSGYGHGCTLVQITPEGPKTHWVSKEIQAHFNSSIYYNQCFFGIGDPGYLVCLNPRDGKAMWKQRGFEKGGVVGVDDTIIAVNGKGGDVVMVSNSWEGYEELGRIKPLGGQSWTAPIVADGKLFVRNTSGMVCLDLM